jgi:predicted HicB family RNase H-like nuclease
MNASDRVSIQVNASDRVSIQLRLPRDLHARLVALAALDQRSLNGEIVAALRHWSRPD